VSQVAGTWEESMQRTRSPIQTWHRCGRRGRFPLIFIFLLRTRRRNWWSETSWAHPTTRFRLSPSTASCGKRNPRSPVETGGSYVAGKSWVWVSHSRQPSTENYSSGCPQYGTTAFQPVPISWEACSSWRDICNKKNCKVVCVHIKTQKTVHSPELHWYFQNIFHSPRAP
jgi:hypothetical protein